MTDYTKVYDGAGKDASGALILGADFDSELSLIATAIATKANKVGSPTNANLVAMDANGDMADAGITSLSPQFSDVLVAEAADHTQSPEAAKGIIWAQSDTPTTLVFTDDAGNDIPFSGAVYSQSNERMIVAASDQGVTGTNTLQDDSELFAAIASSGSFYSFELFVILTHDSGSSETINMNVNSDSGILELTTSVVFVLNGGTHVSGEAQLSTAGGNTEHSINIDTGFTYAGLYTGAIYVPGDTFRFEFAPNTIDTWTLTRKAGSYLKVTRLG